MQPVGFEKINQKDHGACEPGQRVGGENDLDAPRQRYHDADIAHAQHAPHGKHHKHGHRRFARSAHNGGNAMRKCQKTIEKCFNMRLLDTDRNDGRVILKERNQGGGKQEDQRADDFRHGDGAENTETHAALDAVILVRAEVLADKGRQRHGEAGDRQKRKAFQFGIGAAARHGIRAEGIDVALHNDIGKGDDGILHAGGKTEMHDLPQHREVKADFPQPYAINRIIMAKAVQAEPEADKLRDGGCRCGGPDSKSKHADKEQIQPDIDQRG